MLKPINHRQIRFNRSSRDYETYSGLNTIIGVPLTALIGAAYMWFFIDTAMTAWLGYILFFFIWIYIPASLFLGWCVGELAIKKQLKRKTRDIVYSMLLGGIFYPIPIIVTGLLLSGKVTFFLIWITFCCGALTSLIFSPALPRNKADE